MRLRRTPRRRPRRGFVIVAVLIVVVVLSLAAYRFTDLMTAEYRAASRAQNSAQARAAARSGVHYATAMLADPAILNGELGGNPYADGAFSAQTVRAGEGAAAEARFVLVAVLPDGSGGYEQRYGCVLDEASRLNINTLIQLDDSGQLLYDALMKLPNMTEDVANAIVDWVDPDDDTREGGAESDHYQGLGSPYRCKNGPLNSIEELLLVRGVTPQVLYGTDRNRNGVNDDDNAGGTFDRGLADYLTVYGREINVDAQGQLRTNVNEADDLPGLYQKLNGRLPQELIDFIMAYKMFGLATTQQGGTTTVAGGPAELNTAVTATLETLPLNRRRITNFLDLVTARVTLPAIPGAPPGTPRIVVSSPLADPEKFASMFGELLDKATTTTNVELVPRINLNTASREVLLAVPQMTEEEADAIVAQRDAQDPTAPGTVTGAWVVTSGVVTQATYRRIAKYVTGRTMVYRIQAVGYFSRGGPVARVEAVIDVNQGAPRTLYFRDLTDLDTPRGFEPPRE